ncbi:hypothetical protein MJH12_15695 [bacterium]|nr:hypothetical protein [bacterium]
MYEKILGELPKSVVAEYKKEAKKQKIQILSVNRASDTITAKFSGIILNLGELIPGLNKDKMIKSIKIKDILSTKKTLSVYVDLKP